MAIQWSESLAVGNAKIDSQHQELFRRINQLLEACGEGKADKAVNEVLDFLEEYVVIHFQTEEQLMTLNKYPEYPEHKKAHDHFIIKFKELKDKIRLEGSGVNAVILTNRMIVDWLTNHIMKVDKKLGVFLA